MGNWNRVSKGSLTRKPLWVGAGITIAGLAWVVYELVQGWSLVKPPHPLPARVVSMPTNGGQLETATVTAWETLELESSGKYKFPGGFTIDLGTTYSRIRFQTVYHYHHRMARVWELEVRSDKTCVVRVSPLEPTLPVSFDTRTMQVFTVSGWARFDKNENLLELQKSITPELAKIAPNYLGMAMAAGRPVLEKWVAEWLLKYEQDGARYRVVILYPGEQPPRLSATD